MSERTGTRDIPLLPLRVFFRKIADLNDKEIFLALVLLNFCPLQSFNQNTNRSVRELQHLLYAGDGADVVNLFGIRFFNLNFLLGG